MPPAECYGTHVANGARNIHVYGYSGLDDGGVLLRMDPVFKDTLRRANQWAAGSGGTIRCVFGEQVETPEVELVAIDKKGGWKALTVTDAITLKAGVQVVRIYFDGTPFRSHLDSVVVVFAMAEDEQ